MNQKVKGLLGLEGITHHSYYSYTTQQNGLVKRRHRSILNTTRDLSF